MASRQTTETTATSKAKKRRKRQADEYAQAAKRVTETLSEKGKRMGPDDIVKEVWKREYIPATVVCSALYDLIDAGTLQTDEFGDVYRATNGSRPRHVARA